MKVVLTVLLPLFAIGVFIDGKGTSIVELESVMKGDSVTLKSGVTHLQTDDEIEWRFNGYRIAKRDSFGISLTTSAPGTFGDRLNLDSQTGDLKISNIKNTDSGQYKLKVSTDRESPETTFTVNVVPDDAVRPVSLMEGDSVTFLTGLAEIRRDDVILWMFGDTRIAEINKIKEQLYTYDEIFRDRLKLDHQTGSLIITNTIRTDSGSYKLKINNSRYTIDRTITVNVSADVKSVSVMEGDSVTLRTYLTETQTDDQILWKFGDQGKLIAHLKGPVNKTWSNIDLNPKTGDLNISNIQIDQHGYYKVEISTRKIILLRKYHITVAVADAKKFLSVKKGDYVILHTDTEIQNNDHIEWLYGDITIAEINKGNQQFFTSDGLGKTFRDRLKLDQTGSLTITNTRTTDSGLYKVKISSSSYIKNSRLIVTVNDSDPDSGSCLSPGAAAGIAFAVILGAAAAVF